ncbi:hypothetical protein DdX_12727 [Ditylenchus destructor]|uniref:Uncharacterized protein n=1 Tax=Ditylenchus destructor TaxID=166010 RepID=A0AAD4R062_9BILA|nr:hypothetical protein DdX_12727 [Ditylenchus destructor]
MSEEPQNSTGPRAVPPKRTLIWPRIYNRVRWILALPRRNVLAQIATFFIGLAAVESAIVRLYYGPDMPINRLMWHIRKRQGTLPDEYLKKADIHNAFQLEIYDLSQAWYPGKKWFTGEETAPEINNVSLTNRTGFGAH